MTKKRDTKAVILDAAEELFSQASFEAVSVRELTGKAGVQLALATYYFPNKQAIFEEVVARRADLLNARRREALRQVQRTGAPDLTGILGAFVRPYADYCAETDAGWRNYSRLIARISHDDQWLYLIERHFNPTAVLFIDALSDALPGLERAEVTRAFVFAAQLMVSAFSNNQRFATLTHGQAPVADPEAIYALLLPFLVGGFSAIASAPRT